MPERLGAVVREFTRTILSPYDLDAVVDRLLEQAVAALDAVSAGILLANDSGELRYAASSHPVELFHEAASSRACACYVSFEGTRVVTVDDFASDDRWPDYSRSASETGLAAVITVPLVAWGQTIGVLNVYRDVPTRWAASDVEACEIVAGMGAAYILGAGQAQAQHKLSAHLYAALRSRGIIERAKGVVMGQQGVDADTAFKMLTERSMHRNQKLRDLAVEISRHGWEPVARPPLAQVRQDDTVATDDRADRPGGQ